LPEIRTFEPTWLDRRFRKDYERLSASEKQRRQVEMEALFAALAGCRHPTSDPDLQRWQPGPYRISGLSDLYEYRCRYPLRIIVRWITPSEQVPAGAVLLVAATLAHDHERIKLLIERSRQEIEEASR
jgi:hypothetical protein